MEAMGQLRFLSFVFDVIFCFYFVTPVVSQ